MKAIITGMNGTVASFLAEHFAHVTAWDRSRVSPDDVNAVRNFLDAESPDVIAHLALGSVQWARLLASECRGRGIRFLFTSTAMVFDHQPDGPHRIDDERTAKDDYGRSKIVQEDAIRAELPEPIIARLGWQIGLTRGGNQMLEALHSMVEKDGVIRASRRWIPATSFLDDTAAALHELLERGEGGTFHVDGNAESALTYPELVRRLAARVGADWRVEETDDYVHDQRLLDERLVTVSIAERLVAPG